MLASSCRLCLQTSSVARMSVDPQCSLAWTACSQPPASGAPPLESRQLPASCPGPSVARSRDLGLAAMPATPIAAAVGALCRANLEVSGHPPRDRRPSQPRPALRPGSVSERPAGKAPGPLGPPPRAARSGSRPDMGRMRELPVLVARSAAEARICVLRAWRGRCVAESLLRNQRHLRGTCTHRFPQAGFERAAAATAAACKKRREKKTLVAALQLPICQVWRRAATAGRPAAPPAVSATHL